MQTSEDTITTPTGDVRILSLIGLRPFENNVYVLVDPQTDECVIVDASEAEPVLQATSNLKVKAILLTHGHKDHHDGLAALRAQRLGAPTGIGAADSGMLTEPTQFAIEDGTEISFGGRSLRAISTPGHTPGSTCFRLGDVLLSGDTLFPGGPGATDPAKNRWGSFDCIIQSIRDRLFTLPGETRVLPGHGRPTTIATEAPNLEEWIARGW